MSQVDTSIYGLANNPQGFDVGKMLSLADMAQQMRMQRTQVEKQNALSGLLGNASSYDPTGSLTPDAQRNANSLNPEFGLKYRQQKIDEHFDQLKEKSMTDEAQMRKMEFGGTVAVATEKARTDALKAGATPEASIDAATKVRKQFLTNGFLSPEEAQKGLNQPYDPMIAQSATRFAPGEIQEERLAAQEDKQAQANRIAQQVADTRAAAEKNAEKKTDNQFALTLRALNNREGAPDPKKDAYAAFKREHPNATSKELADFARNEGAAGAGGDLSDGGKQLQSELTIQGVALPQGMRSAKTLNSTLNNLVAQYPDKSAAELVGMIKSGQLGMKAATGETQVLAKREGNIESAMEALNSKGGMYDQLLTAAKDVDFGDSKTKNQLRLAWQGKVVANPKIQRLRDILEDTQAEVVTVLSRSGQPTESVRQQAKDMFPMSGSYEELATAVDASKKVATAVRNGNQAVLEALKSGKPIAEVAADIQGDGSKGGAAPAAPKPGDKYKHASGATVEIIG